LLVGADLVEIDVVIACVGEPANRLDVAFRVRAAHDVLGHPVLVRPQAAP